MRISRINDQKALSWLVLILDAVSIIEQGMYIVVGIKSRSFSDVSKRSVAYVANLFLVRRIIC